MSLTPKEKNGFMGQLGEKIVADFLRRTGHIVKESLTVFDSEKDMTVFSATDTTKIEVKTQVPYLLKNSFTFREQQLKKVMNVGKVYFVSVPIEGDEYSGVIFEWIPNPLQLEKTITKDGRKMFYVNRKHMTAVEKITDQLTLAELKRFSISVWKK